MEDVQTIISNQHKLVRRDLIQVTDTMGEINDAARICRMLVTDLLDEPLAAATYKGLESMGVYNLEDAQYRCDIMLDYLSAVLEKVDNATRLLYDLIESVEPPAAAAGTQQDTTGDVEQ